MPGRLDIRRLRGERGAYLPLFALSLLVFFGFAALAIDVGSAYWKKRDLQNAEDAAALAGAAFLPCLDSVNPPSGTSCLKTAQTVAKIYLRENGYDPATFTFDYGCMPAGVSDKTSCAPRFDYFKVNDHAVSSPNVFAGLFGVAEFRPHASAAACNPCSTDRIDYDVVVVLDRTGSMCQDPNDVAFTWNCNDLAHVPASDLANAKNGILTFLKFFNPVPDADGHFDRVGLVVLSGFNDGTGSPPTYNAGNPLASNYCGTSTVNTTAAPGNWLIVPLRPLTTALDASWTWVNPVTNQLNATSRLASAVTCVPGGGDTVMNQAAKAADQELARNGRSCRTCRRIVVYLGDGGGNNYNAWNGANAAEVLKSTFDRSNPCGSTIWNNTAADQNASHGPGGWGGRAPYAAGNGITWFSIGYALDFNPFGHSGQRCRAYGATNPESYSNASVGAPIAGEAPYLSSGTAMRLLASNDAYYFNQPTPGALYDVFNQIGHVITQGGVRLVG